MSLEPDDGPWSINPLPDGDELLDAHNDILLKFQPNIEPKTKKVIAAAPEMAEWIRRMLLKIKIEIEWANATGEPLEPDDAFYELCDKGANLLDRIGIELINGSKGEDFCE